MAHFRQGAEITITWEIGDQIHYGFQSTPKAMCPSPELQLLDNLSSLEPTKLANRAANVPLVNWGVIDRVQISDTHYGPPPLWQVAVMVALPKTGCAS